MENKLVEVRTFKRGHLFTDGEFTFVRGRYNRNSQCYICHFVRNDGIVCDKYRDFRPYDLVYKF